MNTKIVSFFGFLSLLALAACGQPPTDAAATPTLDFGFDEAHAACQASSDCVLMKVGGCDTVRGIHVSQVDAVREYSEQSKKQSADVQCAPSWPVEAFEPLCLNQQCRAVPRNYHLLLEVPDQPIAGQPFWIGLRFRFDRAAGQVEARILLPPGVEVVAGQAEWSGAIEAGQELVFWAQVVANAPGKMNLVGWAKLPDDPAVTPLTWSQAIEVAAPHSLTPWPERERILATPTRAFTPTATLTRQPTATASITPTPTPHPAQVFAEPLLAAVANIPPHFAEDFSKGIHGWSWDDHQRDQVQIVDGVMKVNGPGGSGIFPPHNLLNSKNFIFEFDVRLLNAETEIGTFFRQRDSDIWYGFTIQGKRAWHLHVTQTESDVSGGQHIQPLGAINQIVIIARGDEYAVYLNGLPTAYLKDDTFLQAGNLMPTFKGENGGNAQGEFDNFKFWDLDKVRLP